MRQFIRDRITWAKSIPHHVKSMRPYAKTELIKWNLGFWPLPPNPVFVEHWHFDHFRILGIHIGPIRAEFGIKDTN